jgi:hypothetical protein
MAQTISNTMTTIVVIVILSTLISMVIAAPIPPPSPNFHLDTDMIIGRMVLIYCDVAIPFIRSSVCFALTCDRLYE